MYELFHKLKLQKTGVLIFFCILSVIFFILGAMHTFFLFMLFLFGTIFGSFASVLIYRLKSGEGGIMNGRSHCKTCSRDLSALELIPIVSWLIQKWKCKGCKQKISAVYPFLELGTWFLFAQIWYFLIRPELIFAGDVFEIFRLFFFLSLALLTIVYVFYDILYLEIPESILLIANILAFWGLVIQSLGFEVFPHLPLGNFSFLDIWISLLVLSWLYYIFTAEMKEIYDCILLSIICIFFSQYIYYSPSELFASPVLSWTAAALTIYVSFFLQIIISKGRWMWAGDLRIAILMGLVVGMSFAFPAWMISYLLGSIIGIAWILFIKYKWEQKLGFEHQIPFWPFLAGWYFFVFFFSHEISNILVRYF